MGAERYTLSTAERQTYRRYAALGLPRHTSYPIVPVWDADYGPATLREDLGRSDALGRPLSLYVHVPFCEQLCYYCACTKEVVPRTRQREIEAGALLLEGLRTEVARFAEAVGNAPVFQLHLGGGSPTYLTPAQLEVLWDILIDRFTIEPNAEIAIEVDPRITTREHLATLRRLGFNRISLGIQDFDPKVQQAVNRRQPFDLVRQFVGHCREEQFDSMNFDLIYGLPFQTLAGMADTLEKTISLEPDRIAFYRLAVIPEIFRWQNVFGRTDMPDGDLPLDLNLLAIERFREAGYEFIGLDHFAKPDEALADARRDGTLRRTFQGMTTGKEFDILGLGPSAITQLDDAYAQNVKTSDAWTSAVQADFATERGLQLTTDDRLRRELMQQLYGNGIIDKQSLADAFQICFHDYFSDELERLQDLIHDGLVVVESDAVRLTAPLGRLLVRVVAAVFDRYLPSNAYHEGLGSQQASKVG